MFSDLFWLAFAPTLAWLTFVFAVWVFTPRGERGRWEELTEEERAELKRYFK